MGGVLRSVPDGTVRTTAVHGYVSVGYGHGFGRQTL